MSNPYNTPIGPKALTLEGPTTNECKIIAVELAAETVTRNEVELEMFACQHTIPMDYRYNTRARITLHTSQGDITVRFPINPGAQYQAY